MSDAGPIDSVHAERALHPLAGGKLLSETTNRIVLLIREHYRRGPIKAKTYILDNLIVCVLTDSGLTTIERTMMKGGEPERVLEMRREFQPDDEGPLQRDDRGIHGAQGACLPQPDPPRAGPHDRDVPHRPAAGFGALELVDPSANG